MYIEYNHSVFTTTILNSFTYTRMVLDYSSTHFLSREVSKASISRLNLSPSLPPSSHSALPRTLHDLALPDFACYSSSDRAIDPEYQQSSPPGEVTPAGT